MNGGGGVESRQQQKVHTKPVKKLDNDFVRSSESYMRERQRAQRLRILARRRIAVLLTLGLVACLCATFMLMNQKSRLAEKQELKAAAEQHLAEVQNQQELLNLQITKLEDDEYIAKLARKEYFLSEEGEIIFTIPKEDGVKKAEKAN